MRTGAQFTPAVLGAITDQCLTTWTLGFGVLEQYDEDDTGEEVGRVWALLSLDLSYLAGNEGLGRDPMAIIQIEVLGVEWGASIRLPWIQEDPHE